MKVTRRLLISTATAALMASAAQAGLPKSYGIQAGWAKAPGIHRGLTAFSPLKYKLDRGNNAVVFWNTDSTGYSGTTTPRTETDSLVYQVMTAIGANYPGYHIDLYLWAEWDPVMGVSNFSQLFYYPARRIQTSNLGANAPILSVYQASLPGSVPSYMFNGIRRTPMLRSVPKPDLVIMWQGINLVNTTFASNGRGALQAAFMNHCEDWGAVPFIMGRQNPFRDDTNNDKVANATGYQITAAAAMGIQVVSCFEAFIAAGKAGANYRDNIHPSTAGITNLILPQFTSLFTTSAASMDYPIVDWNKVSGASFIPNSDFKDWTGATPTGFTLANAGTVYKDQIVKDVDAPWSVGIVAGTQLMFFSYTPAQVEIDSYKGAEVSYIFRARRNGQSNQTVVPFVRTSAESPNTEQLQINGGDETTWEMFSGVAVPSGQTAGGGVFDISMLPTFGHADPQDGKPMWLHKMMMVPGRTPIAVPLTMSLNVGSTVFGTGTLSNNNLSFTNTSSQATARGVNSLVGKKVFSGTLNVFGGDFASIGIGAETNFAAAGFDNFSCMAFDNGQTFLNAGTVSAATPTMAAGNRIGVAVDTVNKRVWFTKDDGATWAGTTGGLTALQVAAGVNGISYATMNLLSGQVFPLFGSFGTVGQKWTYGPFVGVIPDGFTRQL